MKAYSSCGSSCVQKPLKFSYIQNVIMVKYKTKHFFIPVELYFLYIHFVFIS